MKVTISTPSSVSATAGSIERAISKSGNLALLLRALYQLEGVKSSSAMLKDLKFLETAQGLTDIAEAYALDMNTVTLEDLVDLLLWDHLNVLQDCVISKCKREFLSLEGVDKVNLRPLTANKTTRTFGCFGYLNNPDRSFLITHKDGGDNPEAWMFSLVEEGSIIKSVDLADDFGKINDQTLNEVAHAYTPWLMQGNDKSYTMLGTFDVVEEYLDKALS